MSINQRTINLVKEFEGYGDRLPDGRCMAYLDRNATKENPHYDHEVGGLWTIGYGATGTSITKGVIWTQVQADADLKKRLQEALDVAYRYIHVKLNENQEGAVASITYNVGPGSPSKGNGCQRLYEHINEDPANAGQYFAAYKYGTEGDHKVVLRGLVRRRTAERELYEWETKAQVKKLLPPLQDADKVQTGTAVGAFSIAGLWQYLPQVKEFMADHNGIMLLGAVGLIFGITELYKWRQHQSFNNGTLVPVGTKPVPTEEETEAFDADLN